MIKGVFQLNGIYTLLTVFFAYFSKWNKISLLTSATMPKSLHRLYLLLRYCSCLCTTAICSLNCSIVLLPLRLLHLMQDGYILSGVLSSFNVLMVNALPQYAHLQLYLFSTLIRSNCGILICVFMPQLLISSSITFIQSLAVLQTCT